MAQRFKPLELGLINEGRFLDEANSALREVQQQLVVFLERYKGRAKGARGQLTLKVQISCLNPEDGSFAVEAAMVATPPAAPVSRTMAIAERTDLGEPALFVRRSGSTADTPRQAVLCTEDGRELVEQPEGGK